VEHSGKHVMAEIRACLLCFEFLCNGSLDKHLSGMLKYNTKIFYLFIFLCKVYLIRSLEHTRNCAIIPTATVINSSIFSLFVDLSLQMTPRALIGTRDIR
jgi:hypothetical protein